MKTWLNFSRTILITSIFLARAGAQDVTNAVVFAPPGAELGNYQPPKLSHPVTFKYPEAMYSSRLAGDVKLNVTINPSGGVEQIAVVESNNPGFEDEALKDVRQLRFRPARVNGQPVARPGSIHVHFDLPNEVTRYPFPVASSVDLPEAYRYDVPPKARSTIQPVCPYPLLIANAEGDATVAFTIGTDGRVHSTRVMKATRPEYGWAVAAAVAQFRFDPALRKGKPVTTISSLHQEFHAETRMPGIIDGTESDEQNFAHELQKYPEQIVAARLLDARPHAFSRRAAVFPPDLLDVKAGTAVVRIVVDETGHARLPRVTSATDPAFGYAAVQAAQYWRFDPPTAHGKAVMTVVEVPFTFAAQD